MFVGGLSDLTSWVGTQITVAKVSENKLISGFVKTVFTKKMLPLVGLSCFAWAVWSYKKARDRIMTSTEYVQLQVQEHNEKRSQVIAFLQKMAIFSNRMNFDVFRLPLRVEYKDRLVIVTNSETSLSHYVISNNDTYDYSKDLEDVNQALEYLRDSNSPFTGLHAGEWALILGRAAKEEDFKITWNEYAKIIGKKCFYPIVTGVASFAAAAFVALKK